MMLTVNLLSTVTNSAERHQLVVSLGLLGLRPGQLEARLLREQLCDIRSGQLVLFKKQRV